MDDSEFQAVIDTPVTRLGIKCRDGKLYSIDFLHRNTPRKQPETDLAVEVVVQLEYYFNHPKSHFDLPLLLGGTPFQQRVWSYMQQVPSGATRSYGQVAAELGSSPRAVGNACRANPCPIIVPCHRIIAANGLGGFAGQTVGDLMDIKRWLLAYENAL